MRHLTEMERVYGVWALGPKSKLQWVWGDDTDDGTEWDIDADAPMVADSRRRVRAPLISHLATPTSSASASTAPPASRPRARQASGRRSTRSIRSMAW